MQQTIEKALEVLKSGGTILYPTDTVWGLGCDARNTEAIKKIYNLKKREESKSLIVLVANDAMLQNIVEVPEVAWQIIDTAITPTTIVYDNPQGIAKNIIAEDNSLAIRLTKDPFCVKLIQKLKAPLISTSANISGESTPLHFEEIPKTILEGVDYVVDLPLNNPQQKASSIIKIGAGGEVKIIRH